MTDLLEKPAVLIARAGAGRIDRAAHGCGIRPTPLVRDRSRHCCGDPG